MYNGTLYPQWIRSFFILCIFFLYLFTHNFFYVARCGGTISLCKMISFLLSFFCSYINIIYRSLISINTNNNNNNCTLIFRILWRKTMDRKLYTRTDYFAAHTECHLLSPSWCWSKCTHWYNRIAMKEKGKHPFTLNWSHFSQFDNFNSYRMIFLYIYYTLYYSITLYFDGKISIEIRQIPKYFYNVRSIYSIKHRNVCCTNR